MAKFIDSDFFRGVLNRMVEHLEAVDATRDAETIKSVIRFLKVMEEFHAVEVVRCKECKNWMYEYDDVGLCVTDVPDIDGVQRHADDFCSYGERRSDDST